MIQNKPTYISLFSSAGVGCYGFKLEGFECIATNELLEKRINIQKLNKKCRFESGYITADIKEPNTKKLIYQEIEKWNQLGNDRVDVVIATPPCQGMSVANHKKKDKEIERNSLIKESVDLINNIHPRFFVFENVSAFWKTGCIDKEGNIVAIGDMITSELGDRYLIHNEVLNFKNYGSNSSRTRTLVIGVDKIFSDDISPIEIMPDYVKEKTLFEVIGDMRSLKWGEYDPNDFFHSFRTYPKHMLPWIENLNQGQSAFDNECDELKPHRIIDGKIVVNKSKNADKYTRQIYDKVAPCIHNRDAYKDVRDRFIQFTINNTNINGETECGRIFTKVINPLAFKQKKLGTERGRISKNIITLSDLQYNRLNWRDQLSGKDKSVTRIEHELTNDQLQARALATYTLNKAKKAVRKFNDAVYGGTSEINQATETVRATQAHHIFAQSEYPSIAEYVENLIMLTPNQHFSMAHPNNNTQYIDRDFQYICLIAKSTKIYDNLTSVNEEKFYDFDDYKFVLNTGLETEEFSSVDYLDFATIVNKIDYFYSDELANNKYSYLIQSNRLVI